MKEKYLRPTIVNSDIEVISTTEKKAGVLPFLTAVAAATLAGYELGKSVKKVFGVTNLGEKFSNLTARKNFSLDFN